MKATIVTSIIGNPLALSKENIILDVSVEEFRKDRETWINKINEILKPQNKKLEACYNVSD